jgi:nucleoside-diphosphate-sugar epimerase
VKYLFQAAAQNPKIKRVVLTSSFGAVLDVSRTVPYTYTDEDWNPITWEETIDPASKVQESYKGSKKFAELEARRFVKEERPPFDLVTIAPSMVFGPFVNPVNSVSELGESNALLWKVASGASKLPMYKFPFWIDVRDLAEVHVQALLRPEAGGRRYLPVPSETFSYQKASEIMVQEFPWAKDRVTRGAQTIMEGTYADGQPVTRELGVTYRPFRETVRDFVTQAEALSRGG